LKQSQASVDVDADGERHLYLNDPGTALLRTVMQAASPQPVPKFAGAMLPAQRAQHVVRLLNHNARTGESELRPIYRHLADQLREALRHNPEGVTTINADPRLEHGTIRAAEREEAFHRAQLRAADGQELNSEDARRFLQSTTPIYRASLRLREIKPHLETHAEVIDEMAAILREGEWGKLGLSDPQAEDAWYRYAKLLSARYGGQGREILKYGHPLHSGAGDRVEREASRSSDEDVAPIDGADSGEGPRYRFDVRRGSARQPERVPRSVERARSARQKDLFGSDTRDEVARESISDLAGFLQKQFGEEGPKAHYSGLGALQDRLVRNLSQLEKANPVAHTAAIRAANPKAQAAVILRGAVPAIERALEGSGFDWEDLRRGLIESRLRGVGSIVIQDGGWVAARAVVGPGVEIGQCAIAGFGAVVTGSIPPYEIHTGNPAAFLRRRESAGGTIQLTAENQASGGTNLRARSAAIMP